MAKRDYYEVLGVARSAGPDELKKAYRSLAKKWHPDRNPGDAKAEQTFKEVNEAYDVLKDERKRAAYDQFGHDAFVNGGGNGAGRARGFGFGGGFGDIFDEMFGDFMAGGGRRQSNSGRGADLRFNLEITLEEAFRGVRRKIRVPTTTGCQACDGVGAAPGTAPSLCPTCGGIGKVRTQQAFFTVERTCPTCSGAGQTITDPCKECSGQGRVRTERSLEVDIPAGVDDGTRVRLAGEGEAGTRGAPSGDLYIFLSLKPHRLFQRDGADLFCSVPVPMTRAALGGHIEVPTIDGGEARVTLPEGTQSGARFRLRGKGMSQYRTDRRGDMYVEIQVETPRNLTREQRALLQQFEEAGGGGEYAHPESAGFFSKVKEFLGGAPAE